MIIMLSSNNIKPTWGSRKSSKKLGRGNGSGKWTFCGRGMNGQNSRSGWWVPDWFEWGQTPLFRRLPKLKGFSNFRFKKHFNIINLSDLEKLASSWIVDIDKKVLLENNLISNENLLIKLLGKGELTKKVNVKVNKASGSSVESVEKVWWKVELK